MRWRTTASSRSRWKSSRERLGRIEARLGTGGAGTESGYDGGSDGGSGGEDNMARVCAVPPVPERQFDSSVSLGRAELIRIIEKKWVNGTKLHYYFFRNGPWAGPPSQIDLVTAGFKVWSDLKIGLQFEEVDDIAAAEIRIGFLQGDGAWSYVGRDVITFPGQQERTMNFGWDLTQDRRREYVAVHEIGHTLGFPHEHQNPIAGIIWDEACRLPLLRWATEQLAAKHDLPQHPAKTGGIGG